jgi:hypothetical protein
MVKKKDYRLIAILADLLEGKLTDWGMVRKYRELNLRNVPKLREYLKQLENEKANEQTLLTFIT